MADGWAVAGNAMLVLMTLSYAASLLLMVIIWPRTWLEWATTLKIAGVLAVFVNACVAVFFGFGQDMPTRVFVFGIATVLSWVFTAVAWVEWRRRRR